MPTEHIIYNSDRSINSKKIIKYNNKGHMIDEYDDENNGKVIEVWKSDSDCNLLEKAIYFDGKLHTKTTCTYTYEIITEVKTEFKKGVLQRRIVIKKKKIDNPFTAEKIYKTLEEKFYDGNGNETTEFGYILPKKRK